MHEVRVLTLTTLASFSGLDGASPYAGVALCIGRR